MNTTTRNPVNVISDDSACKIQRTRPSDLNIIVAMLTIVLLSRWLAVTQIVRDILLNFLLIFLIGPLAALLLFQSSLAAFAMPYRPEGPSAVRLASKTVKPAVLGVVVIDGRQ